MAATIAQWAIGKHLSTILLVPQTVNTTTGGLTDTTPTRSFYGHLKNVELETSRTFENISPIDRPFENNVIIEQGTRLTLTEHEKSAGTNLAAAAAYQADYWKYTITRGGQSFIGYGVLDKYTMNAPKQGVDATFVLAPIDVGTDTIAYA